ncbi:hypothetical protein [Lysobacter capsici]|uniref:hypothetical protein n=1 Tax=Lysobacter capsici TaxID=435897 RepID=UPI00287B7F6A|nr:hypothetical protein [Lysobacter capsici]WND79270.1 hypothetical protein RJ610_18480 [Lysobacter capsici]WND84466.1 hypothetical protein RJ609_18495 [Lysobacter capsici]
MSKNSSLHRPGQPWALVPLQQLLEQPEPSDAWSRYMAEGDDPQFEVRATQGGALPATGWYLVTVDFDVDDGAIVAPCLYPDYGRVSIWQIATGHLCFIPECPGIVFRALPRVCWICWVSSWMC